jgi:ubiquinone/menaquinone biosynthesis C-methylase UbiE
MGPIFTSGKTELENGKVQTWYGHTRDEQLEDFLPNTYSEGKLMQRRFKNLADTYLVGNKKDVLEIGAGSGDLSVYASSLYPDNSYTISDISPDMLNRFFPRVKQWFKSEHDFKLAYFPAEDIPFPDESFDVVLMKSTVHHFDDFSKAFSEIRRVLRKGGVAVFVNDPVCANVPLYREIRNLTFAFKDRLCGSNCRIYPFSTYLACGKGFSKVQWHYDPAIMEDIRNNRTRSGWKQKVFSVIEKNPTLFGWFFAWRFNSYTFAFTK